VRKGNIFGKRLFRPRDNFPGFERSVGNYYAILTAILYSKTRECSHSC
jgi:hypothetical protein